MADRMPVTTLAQLRRVLARIARVGQSVVIYGEPGVGKTAAVEDIAAASGRKFFSIHGPQHGQEDFKFPLVNIDRELIKWVQSVFPTDPAWNGIIFVDEFGLMAPMVQGALLGLFHSRERRIGTEYVLPQRATVIAATNRMEDGGGCIRTIAPLSLRCNKIDFKPDTSRSLQGRTYNDEFCEYLSRLNYPAGEDVISFVRCFPDQLHTFKPSRIDDSTTPRAWCELAQVLDKAPDPDDVIIAGGKIGPTAATEFNAHRELTRKIDPIEVINFPDTASVPVKEPALLWATVTAVAGVAKTANRKQQDGILRYLLRCPAECAVYGVIDAMAHQSGILTGQIGAEFLTKFGPLISPKQNGGIQ